MEIEKKLSPDSFDECHDVFGTTFFTDLDVKHGEMKLSFLGSDFVC